MGGWFTDLCIALHSYARYFSCSQLSKSCQYQKQSYKMIKIFTPRNHLPKNIFCPPASSYHRRFQLDCAFCLVYSGPFHSERFSQAKRTFNVQFKARLKIAADFFSAFMKEKWQITGAFMLLQCHPEHAVAKLVQVSKQRGEHYVYRSI